MPRSAHPIWVSPIPFDLRPIPFVPNGMGTLPTSIERDGLVLGNPIFYPRETPIME